MHKFLSSSLKSGLVAAGLAASVSIAWAHAHLAEAQPAPKATVSPSSIKTLELVFTEEVEPAFSGVELRADGNLVPVGSSTVAPTNAKRLVTPVAGHLVPGSYEVRWHVLSTDGHKTRGAYTFTVK